MKLYWKRAGLLALYHLPAHFVGSLVAGLSGIIIAAFFERHHDIIKGIVRPTLFILLPIAILFYIFHREAYEKRRFEPMSIVVSAIPFFIIQHISLCTYPYGATMINGGYYTVGEVIFHKLDYLWQHLVTQLGLQLLIYLPTYLFASYCGYKHRLRENERMIAEHEVKTQ